MTWTGWLIGFAVILHSIESLWVPSWRWSTLRHEFPSWSSIFLEYPKRLMLIRLVAAFLALMMPNSFLILVLVVTTWLYAWRWRGTFNGGTDSMTLHILIAWWVAVTFPRFEHAALIYIAVQMLLSYFVSGLMKARNRRWWSGQALHSILRHYGHAFSPRLCVFSSWVLIAFELAFPLAVFAPGPLVLMGLIFHFLNAYVFGLNRFFFVWMAGYPSLFAAAGLVR